MRHQNRKGAAMVEFALVLPFFMFLFLGALEFGQFVRLKQQAITASETGARFAVTGATPETIKLATNRAFWGLKDPTGDGNWNNIRCPNPNTLDVTHSNLAVNVGESIQVTVKVDFQDVLWTPMLGKLIPTTIVGSTTMANESY